MKIKEKNRPSRLCWWQNFHVVDILGLLESHTQNSSRKGNSKNRRALKFWNFYFRFSCVSSKEAELNFRGSFLDQIMFCTPEVNFRPLWPEMLPHAEFKLIGHRKDISHLTQKILVAVQFQVTSTNSILDCN